MMNILNGGVHADNKLDFQEFMIIPQNKDFKERIRCAAEVFHNLKKVLKENGYSISVGDEGGFAPNISSNYEALDYITKAVISAGYKPGDDVKYALDVAASEFYNSKINMYEFSDNTKLTTDEMIDYYADLINKYPIVSIEDPLEENDFALDAVFMEPGRSIVADAGITLYQTGGVKEVKGYRNYVTVDGGMTDNPRYALYKSEYTVLNASRAGEKADYECTVAGRCCESGDRIAENIFMARPERGDIIAVLTTGAYNYAMASNYNRVPRPAMVMIADGKARLVVKRESFEDMIRNEI